MKAAALVLLGVSQHAWGQEITCEPSSLDEFDYEVRLPYKGVCVWCMKGYACKVEHTRTCVSCQSIHVMCGSLRRQNPGR